MKKELELFYREMSQLPVVDQYHDRHGTQSFGILTVCDDERAASITELLRPRIADKVVVEIGGAIGLLACHLAEVAKQVICFESDPTWMSCFVHVLYQRKPRNLTYVFGDAAELAFIRADVALFCTHSGHDDLSRIARLFAPEVIDVYAELVGATLCNRNSDVDETAPL